MLDRGQILLEDLRKGILGETNSYFLGMVMVGQIFTAALSRAEVEEKSVLPDFHLYVWQIEEDEGGQSDPMEEYLRATLDKLNKDLLRDEDTAPQAERRP